MKIKKLMAFALCIALCAASAAVLAGCNNVGQEQHSAVSSQQAEDTENTNNKTADNKQISSASEEESSKEQTESGNEESKDDIALMSETEKYLSELTNSDEYKNMDISEKKKKVLALLDELIEKGLVEKGSVTENDDMIGFQYKGGILGGVQLKEWDSDMNNINNDYPDA